MEWVLFVFSPAMTCLVHSPISARGIQQKSLVFLMVGAYNSTFLIIYKPLSLIISSQTFSMQLGTGTSLFCLSQCAISFCILLTSYSYIVIVT